MRTTIELPDDLYRTLKARAGLNGVTLRRLVLRLIEQGLSSSGGRSVTAQKPNPPPVIVAPRGVPIAAVPRAEIMRIDEEEDAAEHARLS